MARAEASLTSAMIAIPMAVVLLAAGAPFRPDAQELFEGCLADRNGPTGRLYGCKDWNSTITAHPGVRQPGDAMDYARSWLRTTLLVKLREAQVPLALAGLVLRSNLCASAYD